MKFRTRVDFTIEAGTVEEADKAIYELLEPRFERVCIQGTDEESENDKSDQTETSLQGA